MVRITSFKANPSFLVHERLLFAAHPAFGGGNHAVMDRAPNLMVFVFAQDVKDMKGKINIVAWNFPG